jgi:hypothetical protein
MLIQVTYPLEDILQPEFGCQGLPKPPRLIKTNSSNNNISVLLLQKKRVKLLVMEDIQQLAYVFLVVGEVADYFGTRLPIYGPMWIRLIMRESIIAIQLIMVSLRIITHPIRRRCHKSNPYQIRQEI